MKKQYFDLIQFFEGYVRNYRRMNLSHIHNRSMFTQREIDYFANLGEMLGFDAFVEDSKFDKVKGRSRPMDLAWWKWNETIDKENYVYLALHLERENQWNKDEDTIEKLFSETEDSLIQMKEHCSLQIKKVKPNLKKRSGTFYHLQVWMIQKSQQL
ncbi:hypothetical protein [Bacillus sp. HNG]|uniref:hypothetical protein n=1 Tax=Bacillus sp. HNG TaxID=2293325 RepID=UPI001CB964B0|nr:hypothetical protein [Bacillus sp. HNG]